MIKIPRKQLVTVYKIASMVQMEMNGTRDEVKLAAENIVKRGVNFVKPDTRLLVMNDVKGGVPSFIDVLEVLAEAKQHWKKQEWADVAKSIMKAEEMVEEINDYG